MPDLTILVPLDGSEPSEQALRFFPALSSLKNLRVRLLGVAESDGSVSGVEESRREMVVSDYLDPICERLRAEFDFPVDAVRRTGQPYQEILEEAADQDVGILLMTTHGRTSTQGDYLGSVADKVVRGATCATLLLGRHASVPEKIRRITVPLDGSELAAEALPVARALAESQEGSIRLVQAVQHARVDLDSIGSLGASTVESLDQAAAAYLSEAERGLKTSRPVETAVLNGPTAEALMADFKRHAPDLLVMTSHGRTGFIKWALGSVTERMIRGPVPVLLLRPQAEMGSRLKSLTAP